MLPRSARILFAIAAVLLAGAYLWPLWRIDLIAPQYPEGLGMLIRVNTVTGVEPQHLENINNLNHYIGMKRIEPDAIPELRIMPWLLAGLIAGALGVAFTGRRRAATVWVALFTIGAAAGIADFWKWQYEYGHEIDYENAPIKIPGMSYQPPLIGSKQLLNFTATSWPAAGGWFAFAALGLGGAALLAGRRRPAAVVAAGVLATACAPSGPRALIAGEDACAYCRMTISDPRFGAQVISATGRTATFDAIDCVVRYVDALPPDDGVRVYVANYERPGEWVIAATARYVVADRLSAPMGVRAAAVAGEAEAQALAASVEGRVLDWDALGTLVRSGTAHVH